MLQTESRAAVITAALRVFCLPDQVVEVRALHVQGKRAVSQVSTDLAQLALWAADCDQAGAMGVYFTPNPLRPDLAGRDVAARKADVVCRHWLLIDSDPARPAGTSATDEELRHAWDVIDRCKATLEGAGLVGAVIGCSGNGWHLCYPIELPADDASQELVKAVLKGLQARCGSELAQVDCSCHDAPRIWKLYGTTARKGEPTVERPHREAWLASGEPWDQERAQRNTGLLPRLLTLWKQIDDRRKGRPAGDPISRAKAFIAKEPPAIQGQRGSDRCFHVACELVKGFGLSEAEALEAIQDWNRTCQPPWSEAELRHKIQDATKKPGPVGARLSETNGHTNGVHVNGAIPSADTSDDPLDQDATAADLIAANVTIRWGWEKWLPAGVLAVLASEPGVGKTRFCMDLARRVYLGLPWPDGALPTFPKESRTLWVPADNQHAELGTLPGAYGFPPEAIYLNATRRNPFAGTLLDDAEDLRDFEARIRRVRPALVFIDTSLNATDKSSHKPEDAKAFFVPLQQIAARTGVVMLCVTHLNAAGKPLGRRIMGQARLVMQLENPDPEGASNRRKLYVVKSNSLFPPALGITMGDGGNEYDDRPPEAPNGIPTQGPNPRLQAVMEWLQKWLKEAPRRVSETISEAEAAGFNTKLLYRGRDSLGVKEFLVENRKWWGLASNEDSCTE